MHTGVITLRDCQSTTTFFLAIVVTSFCLSITGCVSAGSAGFLREIEEGDLEGVNGLLKSGIDPNGRLDLYGHPLHAAAAYNHVAIGKVLVDHGARLDLADREGRTALHVAADDQSEEFVAFLLEQGAPPNARDAKKNTALHYACLASVRVIVRALLDHGAEVSSYNAAGDSPLHMLARSAAEMRSWFENDMAAFDAEYAAVVREEGVEIASDLLDRGLDIDYRNGAGKTALDIAQAEGYPELAAFLQSYEPR